MVGVDFGQALSLECVVLDIANLGRWYHSTMIQRYFKPRFFCLFEFQIAQFPPKWKARNHCAGLHDHVIIGVVFE